ncbi:MAG: BatA and WFA domain-containing protein [Clostridia bacterium]|nr:BatA and WFA domain-containing protein [Clostridia bacterium]
MSFVYPLGLIGLVGVPILILIYILRNKYNEQTVTSTYLWTLSERFFKRRNPLSGLTGIISLILQIITVIIISLAIARPIFVLPNSASEHVFVIDCSGSMNTVEGVKTRFEKAKDDVKNKINKARLGSTYTLVSVLGDGSEVVFERLSDKTMAKDMLADLECTDGPADYSSALATAQDYFDKNTSSIIYLVTDKSFENAENVEIVNVSSQKSTNYAISEVAGELVGETLYARGNVISYSSDATLEVELYVNGGDTVADSKTVSVAAGEGMPIELSCNATSYSSIKLVIKNKDDLDMDNEAVSYNLNSEASYSILIVSETPFFFEAAFDAITDSVVDVVTPDEYSGQEGYGLYVFHSYTPEQLPDAAVWLINSTESVADCGFGIRGVIGLDEPGEIVKSNSTATRARALLSSVDGKGIVIKKYVKYSGMYTQFTTLFSYDSNPLIFAGINALGNREVVFGFDIHDAHFAVLEDFVILISNLLEYSCPDLVEKSNHVCGEELNVNITANIESVKVTSPDGEENYLDTSTDVGSMTLDKVGTYTVNVVATDGEKAYKVYSAASPAESDINSNGISFSISGEQTFEKTEGRYDPIMLMFVLLAIVFTADWMVYCYEKYQLR